MKTQLFALLLAFALAPFSILHSQVYTTDSGYAEFAARAPLNSYTGETNQLSGTLDLDAGTVDFQLPVKTIDTGIDKRDEHMYELLEVEEYPLIEFTGELTRTPDPDRTDAQPVTARGDFTIRGYTRTIEVTGTLQPAGEGWQLTADWSILLSDYEIEQPTILLIYTVKDRHDLHIEARLKPSTSSRK